MSTVDSYTYGEVDQLAGAMLYVGRVHNMLANALDATRYHDDMGLLEYVNHAPTSLVLDLLPTTAMLLAEVKGRIEELQGAVAAAMDFCAERVAANADVPADADAFAKIMHVEFGKKAKKDGLS